MSDKDTRRYPTDTQAIINDIKYAEGLTIEHKRAELKRLDRVKQAAYQEAQTLTEQYIKQLDGRRGIYISDHAIVRYLERVKLLSRIDGMSDEVFMHSIPIPLEVLRDEMITLEDDRKILKGQKSMYIKGEIIFIIKELTVVTVLNKI